MSAPSPQLQKTLTPRSNVVKLPTLYMTSNTRPWNFSSSKKKKKTVPSLHVVPSPSRSPKLHLRSSCFENCAYQQVIYAHHRPKIKYTGHVYVSQRRRHIELSTTAISPSPPPPLLNPPKCVGRSSHAVYLLLRNQIRRIHVSKILIANLHALCSLSSEKQTTVKKLKIHAVRDTGLPMTAFQATHATLMS
jgi:hypothetical protein